MESLLDRSRRLRKQIVELCYSVKCGHIGSSLSCADILAEIFFRQWQDGDLFILSKGHAAAALYNILVQKDLLSISDLQTFYKDGTFLGAHPPCGGQIPVAPFGTGSLGHGLSLANGLALSQRYTGKKFSVYCLLSDGECNEGSIWEAALFASHHGLSQIKVVVDKNDLQGLGSTEAILTTKSLARKFDSFGFEVKEVDGHCFNSMAEAFSDFGDNSKPKCLIANTTKGKGVSFMENKFEWHYLNCNHSISHIVDRREVPLCG